MARLSSAWRQLERLNWPQVARTAGVLLGTEQVAAWWLGGAEPNLGVMTFAGALIMIAQRTAEAQVRRNDKRRYKPGEDG